MGNRAHAMRYGIGVICLGVILAAWGVGHFGGGNPEPETPPLEVVYFFVPSCPGCAETSALVDRVEREHAGRVKVSRRNLEEGGAVVLDLMDRLDAGGIGETPSLAVFVGEMSLAGAERIQRDLPRLLRDHLGGH